MRHFLEFEKPLAELEGKIEELRHLADGGELNIADEVSKLETKVDRLLRQTYAKLSPWQKVQLARHPDRPHGSDYIAGLVTEFTPLAGDRAFAEDRAVIGGLGRFRGRAVVVLAHEKGADTDARVRHNFGMARPEGYRKAVRLMALAQRFGLPVLSFVDTAGAYPGIEAEARGQAEAIARSIATCLQLEVPLIATVIGEGGSGGAIALAAGNKVLMLEHAIYSVISPEGCASILWRSATHAEDAAEALKLTAQDLLKLGVIDQIVSEPLGGAHRDKAGAIAAAGDAIEAALCGLLALDGPALRKQRREKFLAIGNQGTLRLQAIAGAAHGVQERAVEALVDLLPEPADMHVDDVGLRIEMVVPDLFQEHRARDDVVRVAHEIFEQAELARQQLDRLAGARHGASEQIHLEIGDLEAGFGARAAGQRLKPRQQLGEGKGLAEIIVAPGA